MDARKTSNAYTCISEDVISKVRSALVYNGDLDESVLSELQARWKRKMIQAGVMNGTIERSPPPIPTHTPLQTRDPNPLLAGFAESGNDIDAQFPRSNPSTDLVMSVKNERDGFYIPQHDGASDGDIVAELNTYAPNDEDDEILNEDDDEEDAIDDDKDIPHLVMCQFDYVKKRKNKWECKLQAGVMQINDKNILFSEAKGDFDF